MIPNKFETYCLEFFKSLESLNLSLSFRARPKIDELPDYIIDEFQKYSLYGLHLDRPLKDKSTGHLLLINKMDSIYFMDKIYKSQTCLFSEINTNLKRSNSKEELLIYLYEVEHALSRILKGFYNTDLPWVYNKKVLTYRITFPPELEDEDERSKKHPNVHKFLGVFDDLNIYFRNTVDQIYDKIKLYIKQTEILPETSFSRLKGQKLQATVVALYYYYLIEAGVKPHFHSQGKDTVKQAMKKALKNDGFDYINVNTFYNLFYAIGRGKTNDPLKVKNLRKVLDLLKDEKARKLAIADLQSIF